MDALRLCDVLYPKTCHQPASCQATRHETPPVDSPPCRVAGCARQCFVFDSSREDGKWDVHRLRKRGWLLNQHFLITLVSNHTCVSRVCLHMYKSYDIIVLSNL